MRVTQAVLISLSACWGYGTTPGFHPRQLAQRAAVPARQLVQRAAVHMAEPAVAAPAVATIDPHLFDAVPLTGSTLDAALKMRCDLTGAGYAIFYANYKGVFTAVAEHVTAARTDELKKLGLQKDFEQVSTSQSLSADGDSPIAMVKRTGQSIFIENAMAATDVARREFAIRYGIQQIAIDVYENGVIEYGTSIGAATAEWSEKPMPPNVPKAEMRKAFEDLGALYVMFWIADADGFYRVKADYDAPSGRAIRERLRGDGDSFVARSKKMAVPVGGNGPVSLAAQENAEVVVIEKDDGTTLLSLDGKFVDKSVVRRAADLLEFGIRSVHFLPVEGGVFEYGVSGEASLTGETLLATLEMECKAAGAAYAIYWSESRQNRAVIRGSYTSPAYQAELKGLGLKLSYADASKAFSERIGVNNLAPEAQTLLTRKDVYIEDMATYSHDYPRREIAETYNVKSVAFVPILGGVLEYGTSRGSGSEWKSEEDALVEAIPNAALEDAIKGGATYTIFWKRDFETSSYELVANYETKDNALNKASAESGKTFAAESAKQHLPIMGSGPVASAGLSGVTQTIDIAKAATFRRKALAEEWGVGKITLVPCKSGVFEYGSVTKDKRLSTFGTEFQETQRSYRRDVFGADDWVKIRSNKRFQKSLRNILKSGVLRARYEEVGTVMAFALFILLWDGSASGFQNFDGVKQESLVSFLPVLSLPISIFSLTAPSLGLLLVFRTNACYARWDNSRKVWGSIINKCRSLVRQANTFFDDDYEGPATFRNGNFRDGRRRIAAETSAFTRCLRTFLRGETDAPKLEVELKQLGFDEDEIEGYMNSGNRQVYSLAQLGATLRSSGVDSRARTRMDETLSLLCDDVGACERIFKTPIPRVYTGHTSRFVGTWLGLLPLAIYSIDPSWNHLITVPTSGLVTFFLLGIEELGLTLEEPFSILPIESFVDASIYPTLTNMVLAEDKARVGEGFNNANRIAQDDAEEVKGIVKGIVTPAVSSDSTPEEKSRTKWLQNVLGKGTD